MSVTEAYKVVMRMVKPDGCAWHEAQTHESLTRYLIEETYELIEAIDNHAPAAEMISELADVLYQVLFHAAIAERDAEGYDLDTVADALSKKLIARHPHVFGGRGHMTLEELEAEWEHLKEEATGSERGSRHPLQGIPAGLPALARATKTVDRLARAKKLNLTAGKAPVNEAQIGQGLLAIVKDAVANGIDPDIALRKATNALAEEMKY